ncbi:MAG: flagellar basal body-associated FliL family protein [Balneolaceae bacterium]
MKREEGIPMAEEVTDQKPKKGSKVQSVGKYFLIGIFVLAPMLLAYAIVDKNYEQIYTFTSSFLASEEPVYFQIEELIVNPAETRGQRYLVVECNLELQHTDHIALVEQNIQRIKHDMMELLSSRTVQQLGEFEERERLRGELAEVVNQAIGLRSVRNLYYTRYVMQ